MGRETALGQRPFLNGGCGRVILPAPKPAHYGLIDDAVTTYPLWINADRNKVEGVDKVIDLFSYPWDFATDSFDGALFSHVVEHIPHYINTNVIPPYDWNGDFDWCKRACELEKSQDGWWAFWSEVFRVCRDGSIIHVLCPYAWSQGAITDPSHHRLLTEHTWTHSMQPDPNAPFSYETGGIHFEVVNVTFGLYQNWQHLLTHPHDNAETVSAKQAKFNELLRSQINVVNDMYAKLRVVK
jgi:hypothetical protein